MGDAQRTDIVHVFGRNTSSYQSGSSYPGTSNAYFRARGHDGARSIAAIVVHAAGCINDASGVKPKAAPAVRNGQTCCINVGEIDTGDPGSAQPPRRLSGRKRRGYCTGSCGARRRKRRRKCPHLCGHDCPAERCTAKPAPATHGVRRRRAEAKPAAGAAGQGERSEFRDERGAQRRGEEDTGGDGCRCRRTWPRPYRSGTRRGAQRAAGQAKRGMSEANGGARDTRPKGRDRAAGSAG